MGRLAVLVIVVVALLFWLRPQKVEFWTLDLIPSQANRDGKGCFTKEKCLVVYVAPWCTYCEACVGAIRDFAKELKDSPSSGITVLVGKDERSKLETMAATIGSQTFVDPQSDWFKKIHGRSLPSWMVLDASGKVTKKVMGAPIPCNVATIRQMLEW